MPSSRRSTLDPRVPTDLPAASARPTGASRPPSWAVAVLLVSGIIYVVVLAAALAGADSELLAGLSSAPILFALTIPIALRAARRARDRSFATIILAGAAAKFIVAYAQYKVAYGYYNGRVDADQYDTTGRQLAPAFRQLNFTTNIGALVGTGYTKIFTGIVYALFGANRVTGFMVFAWIGFLGFLFLARAFTVGIPSGDPRRYLIAVLFLPSLLYWPAAIGKEAIIIFGIGLCAYGVASLFRGRVAGLVSMGGGLFVVLLIRPHIALLIFTGVAFAFLVRKAPARTYAAPVFRMLGLAILVVLAFVILAKTQSYLDRSLKTTSLSEQSSATEARTSEGGSSFAPATVNTPIDLPFATVTVLFRPFPSEASGLPGLLSSFEGVLLVVLLVQSRKRIRSVPRLFRTNPYLAFALAYTVTFVIAFSRFANFGLLARQRVQVIPFLLVLIALPKFDDLVGATTRVKASTRRIRNARPIPLPGRSGTPRRLRPDRSRIAVSSGEGFAPPTRAPR